MSTADRPETDAPAPSDVAAQLQEASFLRLVAAPTGDAVAAAGLLARAVETPYQASIAPLPGAAKRATEADCTVSIGMAVPDAHLVLGATGTASRTAFDVAERLGGADPVLACAGIVAAGEPLSGGPLEAADLPRRPGLAVPTADPVAGLAHSTLASGPFSGEREAAAGVLDGADGDGEAARRRRASLVALAVAQSGTDRGARAIEGLLRPAVGGPFRTVGGYADVLDALAGSRPSLALACALGSIDDRTALETWRAHGERAHAAVASASTARYDGLLVATPEAGAPLETVARLLAQYHSPEPVVLAVADGRAAVFAADDTDAGGVLRRAAETVAGEAAGTPRAARASVPVDTTEFTVAVREAL